MKHFIDGRAWRAARGIAVWLVCCLFQPYATSARADDRPPLRVGVLDQLPYGQQPVDYFNPIADNAVERLNQRLESGETTLERGQQHGYLKSLLDELDVPVCSQLLVFSKTAVNQQLVGPRTPRAVYFNDEVYVAWVPDAPAIEVAAVDRFKGALFYQLPQDPGRVPRLVRESRCLGCHVGNATLHVPGPLSRSMLTDLHGKPLADQLSAASPSVAGLPQPKRVSQRRQMMRATGAYPVSKGSNVTHQTPLRQRWGGWYVTGMSGQSDHSGNTILSRAQTGADRNRSFRKLPVDPETTFDVSRYPSPGSDAVAHLIFNHQVHGQNLMARVLYEARFNRRSDAEERLVRYLLFADEAPLDGFNVTGNAGPPGQPAVGARRCPCLRLQDSLAGPQDNAASRLRAKPPMADRSPFARRFESRYPADSPQGALRQLDLKGRVFKHRLSYLVDTPAFQALPRTVKLRLSGRIENVLDEAAHSEDLEDISPTERLQLVTILRSLTAESAGHAGEADAGRPLEKLAEE